MHHVDIVKSGNMRPRYQRDYIS